MERLSEGNNTFGAGTVIFSEGRNAQELGLLLRGKIDAFVSSSDSSDEAPNSGDKSFKLFSISQSLFIGVNDLYMASKHSLSYRAADEVYLHVNHVENHGQLLQLLKSRKEYASYFVHSIAYLIDKSYSAYDRLGRFTLQLDIITRNLAVFLWSLRDRAGLPLTADTPFMEETLEAYQSVQDKDYRIPTDFQPSYMERDHGELSGENSRSGEDLDEMKIRYYAQLLNLPVDLRKEFFGSDDTVVGYHCYDASRCLQQILTTVKACFRMAEGCFSRLLAPGDKGLIPDYCKLLTGADSAHAQAAAQTVTYMLEKIKDTAGSFQEQYAYKADLDLRALLELRKRLQAYEGRVQVREDSQEISGRVTQLPEELVDSAEKLLAYSEIAPEKACIIRQSLDMLRQMEDKTAHTAESSKLRNSVVPLYFEVYEAVFKRARAEGNNSRLVDMFLNYGFFDEKLLFVDQSVMLYEQSENRSKAPSSLVYTLRDWLEAVYTMEKDPSVNEFQEDYFDTFRMMKKRGEITEKEKPVYEADANRRLHFEIINMFRVNHKLCHGRISSYFPFLHSDMIASDIPRSMVKAEMLQECLERILQVDYSAFHREVSYRNAEKGIEKLFIMKEVKPEIILMPIYGSRAIMWQEITGRNKGTPARFIFPALTDRDLYELLLSVMGNFRWELCRTVMGVSWNDITQKSLTSEYTDYIQFFNKNIELHEEVKAQIKGQVQKYHNKTRDIFTFDYKQWINYEANGYMRLNKVSRRILYRHCPFSREIRNNLAKQPIYLEIDSRFQIERAKQIRQIEGQYRQFFKGGPITDSALAENLSFYKDL